MRFEYKKKDLALVILVFAKDKSLSLCILIQNAFVYNLNLKSFLIISIDYINRLQYNAQSYISKLLINCLNLILFSKNIIV